MLSGKPRLAAVGAGLVVCLLAKPGVTDDAAASRFGQMADVPRESASVAGIRTGGSAVMDLDQLIRRAISANKGLAAAHIAVAVAEEDVNIARGRSLPRLDAFSTLEHFPIRDKVLIPRSGGPEQNNPFEETVFNYGFEITLPLYTGGRLRKQVGLAQAQREAAASRVAVTEQELIFNVTSAYYTYLLVKELIAANEATIRSLQEALRIERARMEVGRAVPADVLRIETRFSRAQSNLAAEHYRLESTLEVLKALLALPPAFRLEPVGNLTPATQQIDPGRLWETALARRPDLAALRQEVASQREAIDIAQAELGPSVDLAARYYAATSSVTHSDAALLLTLRVPLYSGDVLQARKRKAVARWSELTTRLAAAERRALAEVEKARLELLSTKARIEASFAAIRQAEESLRIEREKFAAARGTSNDLLLAEEALLAARTQYAAAVASSRQALAALQLATGEIGPISGK